MDALSRVEYLTMYELHLLIATRRDVLAIDEWWRRFGMPYPIYEVKAGVALRYKEPKGRTCRLGQ